MSNFNCLIMNILIYTSSQTIRLTYVCNQVLNHWFGLKIEWTENKEYYKNYRGVKLNYSNSSLEESDFLIPKSTLLSENSIKRQALSPHYYNKIPALFQQTVLAAVFDFDLFANIFFHLSRYEEYLPYQQDKHGRFPASESWFYQNACLQIPVVDLLVKELKIALQKKYPSLIFKEQTFQFLPTYDIDMAWAFRHKGWKRGIGGYVKNIVKGQFIFLKNRFKTHLGIQNDPFQTFDLLQRWTTKYDLQPIYFFLLGDYAVYDTNNEVNDRSFQKLISSISVANKTGIHPSYRSSGNQSIINKEKDRLALITQQPVHRSRQHFLKLHLPTTYQQLLKADITEDYSMGYAMDTGFRAGTSLPFYWYDLANETTTHLLIYPFSVMEVTLKEYLHFNAEEAKDRIENLIKSIKSVDGLFCSLWHNSSFSQLDGYENWESVYEYLLEEVNMEIMNGEL